MSPTPPASSSLAPARETSPEIYLPPPPPKPAEMLRKWIYYRVSGLGARMQRGYVQAVRGGSVLEITDTVQVTRYPRLHLAAELEVVLVQTVEEEQASAPVGEPDGQPARPAFARPHNPI